MENSKSFKTASNLLQREVDKYRDFDFKDLARWADSGEVVTLDHQGIQIEIEALWEDKARQQVRVIGFSDVADRKWWKAFTPRKGYSFIKNVAGGFADEG